MKRVRPWFLAGAVVGMVSILGWKWSGRPKAADFPEVLVPTRSEVRETVDLPTTGERLLEGYGDPSAPPIEDLRKIHRVLSGYFSVVKDPSRYPIGGNEDLAAALKGENANREIFVRGGHPVFSKDGLLVDRWGSPLIVHPEGWKQITLRSAGKDREPYTEDDLILLPTGVQGP